MGCVPNGPARYPWILGRLQFETFLRSACLEWLCQILCSYARYLDVSTLHTFKFNRFLASSSTNLGHCNFSCDIVDDFSMQCAFQDPVGYPWILDIINLRPLYGRHAYKASSRSALLDSLQPCLEIWGSLHYFQSRL
jgi:hypothetical protein